jgi:hypothetical protein
MTQVMRSFSLASSLLLVSLVACGGKPAQSPENGEDNADGGSETADNSSKSSSSGSSGAKAPGEDAEKKKTPCSGFDIPDLAAVLSQTECEVGAPKEGAAPKELKDALEIKAVTDSMKVAPGSTATITVTFRNKSKADLALDFLVDPEPRFDFELYTLKGSRADAPKGDAPSLPPEVSNAEAPEQKIARVTIAANGTARLTLKWNAVTYKWASKERAKGALPGHGYPKEPAGPVAKGKYVLRVVTPLTGVAEGSEHEWSQPRAQVEVGAQ